MQVRTPTALLILLSLALSLLSLTYNLVQNRTGLTDPLYADSPHSYFTLKYHTYAKQINTVQFAARVVVVGLEISTLVFYVADRQKQKTTGQSLRFCVAVEFLLLCLLFIWQGVVTGYGVQCQLQIGFKEGNKTGDIVMAVLEGVTLTAILIALITFAYYFTTIHPKTAESLFHQRSDCPQLEDKANSTRGDGKECICLEEGGRAKQQAINHFKPQFEQYHSPMSRMFQNMSHIAEQEQPAPASNRKPLLEQKQPIEISFKESSKEEPAKKLKIVVPRLKLGEVRKKETQQDFLYPLNNLQISIIGPQPNARLSHRSSSSSDSS